VAQRGHLCRSPGVASSLVGVVVATAPTAIPRRSMSRRSCVRCSRESARWRQNQPGRGCLPRRAGAVACDAARIDARLVEERAGATAHAILIYGSG